MSEYVIPIELQSELQDRVNLCQEEIPNRLYQYIADARGKFVYIRRYSSADAIERIGRLTYNGDINDMEFAIFKYSNEKYSSDEFFLGMEELDGTVEGAIRAGVKAYPEEAFF